MPPFALGVAANSYVGSGSITINSLVKQDLARFQAILEPIIPPPIIAILLTKTLCQLWYERRRKYLSRNAKNLVVVGCWPDYCLSVLPRLLCRSRQAVAIGNRFFRQVLSDKLAHCFDTVSYTHLTLPTNREV